ncbi:Molybdopterin oxidoreductase [Olavius sp. associated proteobacterium Delta 1]|nr:Molybdopterin oxidoreductase [Olavius sp. associated proteobacterium Delta 1]
MKESVYSICGMCTVRCPIKVDVEEGVVKWIEGNPNDPGMAGRLCAKGSAGLAMLYDYERPQHPMIRQGQRGEGKWEKASWDEALDYISEKLNAIIKKHGAKAIALSDRGGPFRDIHRSFLRAIGSPNYFNHDCTCARNVQHAALSLFGSGRKTFNYDYGNCKHLVLYGRNVFESLRVKAANNIMNMLDSGGKITYIDPRAAGTAMKATRYWAIRPGTDYALNLGIIHTVLRDKLYDAKFVNKWVDGLKELEAFVIPYTPEWAEQETGIAAREIVAFAHEIAQDSPAVIFHPGWMMARYSDSFYAVRTNYILNALMGAFETPGGLFFQKGPGDVGAKGLKSLLDTIPKPEEKRVDGCGWKHKHFDAGPGLLQFLYPAILSEDPYPVKAYIAFRHDPLLSLPDPAAQKEAFDKLDLVVAIDANYSETGWYADVLLPSATYLEKSSVLTTGKGLKPGFSIRQQAVEPRNDAKPDWWIFKSLAERLGAGEYFKFKDMQDFWEWQLQDTGITVSDLEKKGSVSLTDKPVWWDRMKDLKFKTPSKKIEFVSSRLAQSGIESFKPYESPQKPAEGHYRLAFGRSPVHTHGRTQNNPVLSEIMPENQLWLNTEEAAKLGISNGDRVQVTSSDGGHTGTIQAYVTEFIHPESVFMVHGFGRKVPWQTRGYNKGLGDYRFETGLLGVYDPVGGANSLMECFVKVEKAV